MYGGGPTVVYSLAEELKKIGVQVTLHDYWKHDPKNFDLVHYFSCTGSENWLRHQPSDPPLVVTPISWFDHPMKRRIKEELIFGARMLIHRTKNRASLGYPFEIPQMFFPNSEGEANCLAKSHHVPHAKMSVVPHGVSQSFAEGDGSLFQKKYQIKDFVLCVGRFEYPRKNQLRLIRALNKTSIPLVFIGGPEIGFEKYYDDCKAAATSEMIFLPPLPRGDPLLVSAYHASRVVVMPALLESPGLTGLEGALAGAAVATTQNGSTKEYYSNHGFYFDPTREDSIRQAVTQALAAPRTTALKDHVLKYFTWNKIAEVQKGCYEKLISPPGVQWKDAR